MGARQSKKSYEVGKVETESGIVKTSNAFKKKNPAPQLPKNTNIISEANDKEGPTTLNGFESIQEEEDKILDGIRLGEKAAPKVIAEDNDIKVEELQQVNKELKTVKVDEKDQITETQLTEDEIKKEKELLLMEIKAAEETSFVENDLLKPQEITEMPKSENNIVKETEERIITNVTAEEEKNVQGLTAHVEKKVIDAPEAIKHVNSEEIVITTNLSKESENEGKIEEAVIIPKPHEIVRTLEVSSIEAKTCNTKEEVIDPPQQFETKVTIENSAKIIQPAEETKIKKSSENHSEKIEAVAEQVASKESPEAKLVEPENKQNSENPSLKEILNIEKEVNAIKEKVLQFHGVSTDSEYIIINEMLIRCIIKLDEISVENDEARNERKRVIKYVQECVKGLEEKGQVVKSKSEVK